MRPCNGSARMLSYPAVDRPVINPVFPPLRLTWERHRCICGNHRLRLVWEVCHPTDISLTKGMGCTHAKGLIKDHERWVFSRPTGLERLDGENYFWGSDRLTPGGLQRLESQPTLTTHLPNNRMSPPVQR
jgi:hypothetical protein